MNAYRHTLDIYAPPEVVWKRAVDEMVFAMAKNSVSMEPEGEIQTGTRFEGVAHVLGRRAIIAGAVSDYQSYQSMAVELDVERSNLPCKPQAARLGLVALNHPTLISAASLTSWLEIEPPGSRVARMAFHPIGEMAGNRMRATMEQFKAGIEDSYPMAG